MLIFRRCKIKVFFDVPDSVLLSVLDKLVNFVILEMTVTDMAEMSKNDEKLPYLHKVTKIKFLVSDTSMGLCL